MDSDLYASFWGHVEQLRSTLVKIGVIICVAVAIAFAFHTPLIRWLTLPSNLSPSSSLEQEIIQTIYVSNNSNEEMTFSLPDGAISPASLSNGTREVSSQTYAIAPEASLTFLQKIPQGTSLVLLGPLEGVLVAIKISLWVGIVASSPLWLWVLFQFITPALRPEEKRLVFPFIVVALLLMVMGGYFAFALTIPIANHYFFSFNAPFGHNLWSLERYLDYTLFLMLANALAFELAALGVFVVHRGMVSAEWLKSKRRVAIVSLLILSAVLTPPDFVTQLLLAMPLILLYEGLIIYARVRQSRCDHERQINTQ